MKRVILLDEWVSATETRPIAILAAEIQRITPSVDENFCVVHLFDEQLTVLGHVESVAQKWADAIDYTL